MAEQKTRPTAVDVDEFVAAIGDEQRRADATAVLKLMRKITGLQPRMWGPTMVGFGEYHYKYATGHEGDYFMIGFSPRKTALTIYIMPGLERYSATLDQLGKHSTGKSCLYIKRLSDVDMSVLEKLLRDGYSWMKQKYGGAPAK